MTEDKQYILATGVYKPRVRCYDVHQLSMKFERCLDAEVVNMSVLSEDYSKVSLFCVNIVVLWITTIKNGPLCSAQFVLLLSNRYLEFHAQVQVHVWQILHAYI